MENAHQSDPSQDHSRPTPREPDATYVYRHAGIREREGGIPLWLALVVVALLVWSVYYTIVYWSAS